MNRRETASPRPTWITQLSEHVQNDLEGRGFDEVEIIIPDIAGTSRGKAMPSYKFKPEESFFLPVSLFCQTISGEYVDMDIEDQWLEKDVTLIPDMSAATVLPWSDDPSIHPNHLRHENPRWSQSAIRPTERITPGPQTF